MLFGKFKKAAFNDILEKVQGKIEGWKAKTFSQAGRTILILAMASAIPSYAMSNFLLPSCLSRKLDKLFKDFW